MKLLLLVFLVGFASASFFEDALDEAADEVVQEYLNSPSVKRSIAWADEDDDIKTELGKKLREALNQILEKIKDAIEHGKVVHKDLLEKLKDLREKLKDKHIEIGNKAKELYEKIKDKAKDFLRKLLENLGGEETKESAPQHAEFIKGLFKKLKDALLSKIDKEALKAKIEDWFGKGSELADNLLAMLKEKGEGHKQKLLDFIDRILKDKESEVDKRSLKELWEKVKDYFKERHIEIKEQFSKFGEFVKDKLAEAIGKGKDKISNIKAITSEFIKHTKDISKEVATEALEFMRPYKDDLGELWEQLKNSVKEVLNRKE